MEKRTVSLALFFFPGAIKIKEFVSKIRKT